MAIFSKKTESEDTADAPVKQSTSGKRAVKATMVLHPRLSEKTVKLSEGNKYVFLVPLSANKVEIRKNLEHQAGVKVKQINIVRMEGKYRRYGRTQGKMSDYKKAIVTLTPDSSKPTTIE